MLRYPAASLALSLACLPAQGPAFVIDANRLASVRAEGVDELYKQWPNTKLGKLLADADVIDAVRAVQTFTKNNRARRESMRATVLELGLLDELEPWRVASLDSSDNADIWQLFRFPIAQMRRAEIVVVLPADDPSPTPRFVTSISCLPRYEGRWSQHFEQEAQACRKSQVRKEVADAKVGGFPAYVFQPPKTDQQDTPFGPTITGRWMLHLPGTFVYGAGNADILGKVAPASTRPAPEVAFETYLKTYLEMFQRFGMGMPEEFSALGLDEVQSLQWSARFVGELLQDEISVTLTDKPKGLVGALLTGTAKLPAQGLPKGAIVQARCAINLKMLADILPTLPDGIEVPAKALADVLKAFDGGIALACCSPAPGGLIPRVYVSLNVADEAALDRLLAEVLDEQLPTKKVTYGGVECTIVKIPDVPQGVQPTFCRTNGKLHIAESARSMRTFLKAQKGGAEAMDVGDAPMPQGDGEVLDSLDMRFDAAELYESYYTHWLPLYELAGMAKNAPVNRENMPEPETIAQYCGKSRGVLRKQGKHYALQHLGALGGPQAAGIAFAWGPMISTNNRNYQDDQLCHLIARHKLRAVQEAMQAFEKQHPRRPKDLPELFSIQKLADDALLLPGDDLAETLELADGRKVKSSFRYFPEGVEFANVGKVLMVEIRPHNYNRAVLDIQGNTPDAYGGDCDKPIDQIGKGGSRKSSVKSAAPEPTREDHK